MSKRVVYADVELAGVVQSAIDEAGLGEQLEAQCHPWVSAGVVVVENEPFTWELVTASYAGVGLLLAR